MDIPIIADPNSISMHASQTNEGGEGLEMAVIGMFLFFFVHLCTSSKLNIQNYPLVKVSGYTYMVQECNCVVQDI